MDFHFDNTPAPSSQRPVRVRRIARGTNIISHAGGERGNNNVRRYQLYRWQAFTDPSLLPPAG